MDDKFNALIQIVKAEMAKSGGQELILFGSRANGAAREDSDYDLMILVDNQVDNTGRWKLYQSVHRRLREEKNPLILDLVIKRREDYLCQSNDVALLSYYVLREGKVL